MNEIMEYFIIFLRAFKKEFCLFFFIKLCLIPILKNFHFCTKKINFILKLESSFFTDAPLTFKASTELIPTFLS